MQKIRVLLLLRLLMKMIFMIQIKSKSLSTKRAGHCIFQDLQFLIQRACKGKFSLIDPIPLKHLGMYAYEKKFLRLMRCLPGKLEKLKSEQLRTLEMGLHAVSVVDQGTVKIFRVIY